MSSEDCGPEASWPGSSSFFVPFFPRLVSAMGVIGRDSGGPRTTGRGAAEEEDEGEEKEEEGKGKKKQK